MLLLAALLAASTLVEPVWAHPGHESVGGAAAVAAVDPSRADNGEGDALRQASRPSGDHVPSALALVAGAVAFLASLPHRRRTIALVLCVLLALVAFEGAAHAALHLRHLPHADGLAVGPSATQQATADVASVVPTMSSLALLEATIEHDVAPVADATVAANQGRAPPILPA